MKTQNIAIDVKGVSKVFHGARGNAFKALDAVSIQVRESEFFTLLGPSGCGKTTLLRLIAGFDDPSDGRILLNGEDIATLPPFKRPVNTVFQNYALFPHMTVAQNIAFGLEMLGRSRADINARVAEMLSLVQMTEMKDRKTSQISGGQQQRVALARALAPQPKVLLLDEPLSALDYKLRKEMQIELKRLQAGTGITFIFVTHDQDEALAMSDRIAVMSEGHILQVGNPRDIYDRPTGRFVANFIGETNFLKGKLSPSAKDQIKITLDAGGMVFLPASEEENAQAGPVTVVVRPENASITSAKAGLFVGVVENIVYFGADTHLYVKLKDGSIFIVRRQNVGGSAVEAQIGDTVGIALAPHSARLIRD